MLVLVACIKHPNNSESYNQVWQLLNNTLYSVCSQQDTDFRVIVVCDKKLPLLHHEQLISKYTEFIEVDFPGHGEDVLNNFDRLGNLSPSLSNACWWLRWQEKDFAITKPDGYFHIANVFLNMGSKLLIGILAARKYNPEYVSIFDGDDYIGNDISAYANSHPGENGWAMVHGYKIAGNRIAPIYAANSICGTGNIINYALLMDFIGEKVSEKSTQNELFEYVDSEFLITLANHKKTPPYFKEKEKPLLEYPTRSVLYQVSHNESSEHAMRILRGLSPNRLQQRIKFGKIKPISAPLISYFNILSKIPRKVFCLGFHKTGTTSLELLMQDMGYQVASPYKNWDDDLTRMLEKGDLSELKKVAELFDAFQDAPWFLFYKEFDQLYPGSKFILTLRNGDSWWKSFQNYFGEENKPLFNYIYGFDNPIGHEKAFVDRFERHNREVIEYFKDRLDDLLVVDVSEESALEKISAFLSKPASYIDMPHENAKLSVPVDEEKNNMMRCLRKIKKFIKQIRDSFLFIFKKFSFAPPIIIGGSKKSGAELLLSILSCHPNIHAIRNIKVNYSSHHPLSLALAQDRISESSQVVAKNTAPINISHLNSLLVKEKIPLTTKRWCGTNRFSVLVYEKLLDYYGKNVRILNIVRDGRDVVTENDAKIMARYSVPCERWVYDVKAGMKFDGHPQVLTIRYEDLIQDYEVTINRICEFIGENDATPFLNFPKGATIVEDKYWIGKWQQLQYSDRIGHLLQTPGAEESLQHYGYLE